MGISLVKKWLKVKMNQTIKKPLQNFRREAVGGGHIMGLKKPGWFAVFCKMRTELFCGLPKEFVVFGRKTSDCRFDFLNIADRLNYCVTGGKGPVNTLS
jgi:hypothetical protein